MVIEPREGDIIVDDGQGGYKLLQLITLEDITFPKVIQEIRYKPEEHNKRIDINNPNNDNWSKRDYFGYMVDTFSINSNKIINLLPNISKISVYVDFYNEKKISALIDLGGDNSFKFTFP